MGAGAGAGPLPSEQVPPVLGPGTAAAQPVYLEKAGPYFWKGIYGQPDMPTAPLGAGGLPATCPAREALTRHSGALRGVRAGVSVPCETQ